MSSMPTPDARAVVRALDALLTQVKRIADHTATGSFALAPPPVVDTDDAPTTPAFVPWPGITADAVKAMTPFPRPAELVEDERVLREHALRIARRDSLGVLFSRVQRGLPLTPDEARLLVDQAEAEMRDADTARAVAAGNLHHVQMVVPEIDRLKKELERADAVTGETKRLMDRRTKTLHDRAQTAETELFVLRCGLRANGADPTQIQNLWAQIRLRNRQWRDATREVRLTRNLLENEEIDTDLIDEMIATVDSAHDKLHEAQAEAEQLRALLATETARANAAIDRETTAEEAAEEQRERVRALRDPIAEALEHADYRQDMRRGDLADSVMPVILAALDGTTEGN